MPRAIDRSDGVLTEPATHANRTSDDVPGSGAGESPIKKSAEKPLQSLTPAYEERHHGTYLARLEEAVKDPNNRNIALTGRYGAGKSSVLNEFEAKNRKAVLRLAISTLAPGEQGETTTNRIQKEIVKQLLYGASEKVGRHSRFNKIAVLTRGRAFMQSAAVVLPLLGLTYVFGALPHLRWPTSDDEKWLRVAIWTIVAVLCTGLGAVVRLVTHGRYDVKDVSAGGAAVTLSEKPQTFFDKYIDEIVYYFAQEPKDIIIFEDLDRFEDPNIFEALRELNVLLNNTPERRMKRNGNRLGRWNAGFLRCINAKWADRIERQLPYPWSGRILGLGEPLRFIYAVRDSVFSRIDAGLGTGSAMQTEIGRVPKPHELSGDPKFELDEAAAETLRANRTKFFDIVIPLVPFISHRNARDLLVKLLDERAIAGIEPRLINTVAQHCTDMRLMRNMCNEYLVFAERLLEPAAPATSAPGLDATHLFALVVYKNFHLEDFENITRRCSNLDAVYDYAQRLTRETVSGHEKRVRELLARPERFREREPRARQLGERLELFASTVKAAQSAPYRHFERYRLKVGSQDYEASRANDYGFWAAVAKARSLEIVLVDQGSAIVGYTFDEAGLKMFVPEALDADRWAAFDQKAINTEIATKERDIELVRRADFAELLTTDFALRLRAGESTSVKSENPEESQTFADLVNATLKSELARDLVRRGYVDRNFSLYAAQFYGNFTGVDVANFMVQHVQPKLMNIDFDLSRPKKGRREGAAANLLVEAEDAGEDLLNSVAAYNIDLLNHLLASGSAGASTVVRHVISTWPEENARDFLAAYFTSKTAHREKLAALLARCRWRDVFTYMASNDDVPADARVRLVDAAAAAFDPQADYDVGEVVSDFLTANYRSMSLFTEAIEPSDAGKIASGGLPQRLDVLLQRGDVVLPDLAPLSEEVRALVVEKNRYTLSADNLRVALDLDDADPVDLDTLTGDVAGNQTVYAYVLANLSGYLAEVDRDHKTAAAVTAPRTLAKVLVDMDGEWPDKVQTSQQEGLGENGAAELLARSAPSSRLRHIRDAPRTAWRALAGAKRFRSSLANIEAYRGEVGSIDDQLARLLEDAMIVHVDEDDDITDPEGDEHDHQAAALAILNTVGLPTEVRVALVSSLEPSTPLPARGIGAEGSDLFARLLGAGLVEDEAETFMHLRAGGWAAVGPAIAVSNSAESFGTAAVLEGMVAEALNNSDTSSKVADRVLANVGEYVPEDDWKALMAVAVYADRRGVPLAPATVARIARVGYGREGWDVTLLLRLLDQAAPGAEAEEVVETFLHLGKPYDRIANSGDSFELDVTDVHDRLLKVLKVDNRITRGYPRIPKLRYSVTVL